MTAPATNYFYNGLDLNEYFDYDPNINAGISTGYYTRNAQYQKDLGYIFKPNVSGFFTNVHFFDNTNTDIGEYFELKVPYTINSGDLPTQVDYTSTYITIAWWSSSVSLTSNISFSKRVTRVDFVVCGGGGAGGVAHINDGGGGGGGGEVIYTTNAFTTTYIRNHSFNIYAGCVGTTGNNGTNSYIKSDNLYYNFTGSGGSKGGDSYPNQYPDISFWFSGIGANSTTHSGGSGCGGYSSGANLGYPGGGGAGAGGDGESAQLNTYASLLHNLDVDGCAGGSGLTYFGYEFGKGGKGGDGTIPGVYAPNGSAGSNGCVMLRIYF